jgi:hypothetical protein
LVHFKTDLDLDLQPQQKRRRVNDKDKVVTCKKGRPPTAFNIIVNRFTRSEGIVPAQLDFIKSFRKRMNRIVPSKRAIILLSLNRFIPDCDTHEGRNRLIAECERLEEKYFHEKHTRDEKVINSGLRLMREMKNIIALLHLLHKIRLKTTQQQHHHQQQQQCLMQIWTFFNRTLLGLPAQQR